MTWGLVFNIFADFGFGFVGFALGGGHVRGVSGFGCVFFVGVFVLRSFFFVFGKLCCCGWTSLRWGELVFGRERWCDFPLVGVAVWYSRGAPGLLFCLLFLGVTVVRAVVSGALPWFGGVVSVLVALFHSSGLQCVNTRHNAPED